MLGMRGKSKKSSQGASPKKDESLAEIKGKTSSKPNSSKKSTKKTKRRISLNCLNNRVRDDDSEVDMVTIDQLTRKAPADSDNAVKTTTRTIKITNMMTPDMLEALGIEEEIHSEFNHSPLLKEEKIEELMLTSAQPTTRKRVSRRSFFADENASVSTSSTCSSRDSYEAVPIDAFDSCNLYDTNCNQDDWNLLEGQIDKKAVLQYYRDTSMAGCTPMTCAGVVLSMPIACGLLCVDNVLDTKLFETATQTIEKEATDDRPEEILTSNNKKRTERRTKKISSPVASL